MHLKGRGQKPLWSNPKNPLWHIIMRNREIRSNIGERAVSNRLFLIRNTKTSTFTVLKTSKLHHPDQACIAYLQGVCDLSSEHTELKQ